MHYQKKLFINAYNPLNMMRTMVILNNTQNILEEKKKKKMLMKLFKYIIKDQ